MPTHLSRYDNIRLHVECVTLATLRATFAKTKNHSARQLKKPADGINRTGFNVPILVDDDFDIVSGHARAAAAKLIGLETVPIIRVSHLNRDERRLFAIFENKIASESTIDLDAVRVEPDEIVISSSYVVLTDSGFEVAEIDAMNGVTRTNELDDLDEDPELPATAVTRLGDLWQLGPHRVACGDSTDAAVLDRLMKGAAARAMISDAPYNLKIPGVVSGKGKIRHHDFAMACGEMSVDEFTGHCQSYGAAENQPG